MKHLYLIFLFSILLSCQEDPIAEQPLPSGTMTCEGTDTRGLEVTPSEQYITIGRKLNNPYTVNNMRVAFYSLKRRDSSIKIPTGMIHGGIALEIQNLNSYAINTTHYYIKITPKSLEEYDLLMADSTLELYPYPLDYEIIGEGTLPYVPADVNPETGEITLNEPIGPLYTSIPKGKTLPEGVEYVILDDIYIPVTDEEESTRTGFPALSKDLAYILTLQAMFITGNEVDLDDMQTRGRGWYPEGYIWVYDTHLQQYVGVENAKVRARSFMVNYWAYTDNKGYYFIDERFCGKATYSVKWENRDWDIRNGSTWQASFHGPKQTGPWDLTISPDCETYGHATITRALSSHFFGPQNVFGRADNAPHRIKISYRHEHHPTDAGSFTHPHFFGVTNTIFIYGLNKDGSFKNSDAMLKTTFHEMGHCAMYHSCGFFGLLFNSYTKQILEGWATMIGWYMVDAEYRTFGDQLFDYEHYRYPTKIIVDDPLDVVFEKPHYYNKQRMTKAKYDINKDREQDYSPLFIDLVDNSNQKEYHRIFEPSNKEVYPDDNLYIKNYPLLCDILYRSTSLRKLKANLLEKREILGITEQNINAYFEFYGL